MSSNIGSLTESDLANKQHAEALNAQIRPLTAEVQAILTAQPLDLARLRQQVEHIRRLIAEAAGAGVAGLLDIPTVDQQCRRPIQNVRSKLNKDDPTALELGRVLLLINDTFIRYSSARKEKLFMNLADYYRTLRLSKPLWDEFGGEEGLKDCLRQMRSLGEEIRTDPRLWASYRDPNRKSRFLSDLGETYRAMVDHGACSPDERELYLQKAFSLLRDALFRGGVPVPRYRDYGFPRLAWCSMRLAEICSEQKRSFEACALFQEAAAYYLETVNLDNSSPLVRKETAWESRCGVAHCMLSLGRAEADEDPFEAQAHYRIAESWYGSAHHLRHAPSVPLWETGDKPLLGKMADLYFLSEQYEKALPFYEAMMLQADSAPPEDKNLYDLYCYRWGVCLAQLHRNEAAFACMERTLDRKPAPEHRLKPYLWMIRLCVFMKDYNRLQEIKQRVRADGGIENDLATITLDHLDIFLDVELMQNYVAEIEDLLDRGEYHKTIHDLRLLIREYRAVYGKDDKVLMTLIARADIGVRNYDDALRTLNYVCALDRRPTNTSIALHYIGRAYLGRRLYSIAAQAFQESFEVGSDLAMLWLAASALHRAGDYGAAINLYQRIRDSGQDLRPELVAFGMARSLWAQYQNSGDALYASHALAEISSLITGHASVRDGQTDWPACQALVEWASDDRAAHTALGLVRTAAPAVAASLLGALAFQKRFQEEFLMACLERLASYSTPPYLLNAAADYLMKASVCAYFLEPPAKYRRRLEVILSGILKLPESYRRDFLCEYLCASKGAYIESLDNFASCRVRETLPPADLPHEQLVTHLIDETAPAILEFLRDTLSLVPALPASTIEFLAGQDWLADIAPIQTEDGFRLRLNPELPEHAFSIALPAVVPRPPGWCAWQSALATLRWFFPDGSDCSAVWHVVLGSCFWSTSIVVAARPEAILLKVEASFNPAEFTARERSERFPLVRERLRRCPIPRFCGFSVAFDCDRLDEGRLGAVLTVPTAAGEDSPDAPLLPFARYMAESFLDGLKGRFYPANYRRRARLLFPDPSPSWIGSGGWVEWVCSYVAQHAALAIMESLGSQHFQRVLHDVSKPFRELAALRTPDRNLVRQCLEKLDSLDYEIHTLRRLQLSVIYGEETRRWVDLEMLLSDITEEEEAVCPDVRWQFQAPPRPDLVYCEPALLRRALTCLVHNATQACAEMPLGRSDRTPAASLALYPTYYRITITNPYSEAPESNRPRTGYGIRDAKSIIEDVHQGKLGGPELAEGYCRVVVNLPRTVSMEKTSHPEEQL